MSSMHELETVTIEPRDENYKRGNEDENTVAWLRLTGKNSANQKEQAVLTLTEDDIAFILLTLTQYAQTGTRHMHIVRSLGNSNWIGRTQSGSLDEGLLF